MSNDTYTKPEPVRLLGAITTALSVLFGGLGTVAYFQDNEVVGLISALGMLAVAAVNAGKDEFLRGQVTPVVDTAAYKDANGTIVAGPAAQVADGRAVVVRAAAPDPAVTSRGDFEQPGDVHPRPQFDDEGDI
jgi:predicted ribosomally synthesized peptide with SipW-like signal peptide